MYCIIRLGHYKLAYDPPRPVRHESRGVGQCAFARGTPGLVVFPTKKAAREYLKVWRSWNERCEETPKIETVSVLQGGA